MSTYFMFGKYVMESIKSISAKRSDAAGALIKQHGGELLSAYALLGDIDLVLLVNFPNLESAVKTSVGLSKLLMISFSTVPALVMADFDKLFE
jgi:uncharacterized protein with GYD domain